MHHSDRFSLFFVPDMYTETLSFSGGAIFFLIAAGQVFGVVGRLGRSDYLDHLVEQRREERKAGQIRKAWVVVEYSARKGQLTSRDFQPELAGTTAATLKVAALKSGTTESLAHIGSEHTRVGDQ
ncbi:hypothetical protein CLCR_06417 [Cladophialophora carrionii]|uniref:Uncharacterized protein n=1 Tax=Cladophialophora carrionii TaxID=86049 RepID=A0A1C1C7X0_9EURO|nr:hypothetical protein CLCR_06417 [Cladophialophora carrionii]